MLACSFRIANYYCVDYSDDLDNDPSKPLYACIHVMAIYTNRTGNWLSCRLNLQITITWLLHPSEPSLGKLGRQTTTLTSKVLNIPSS